MQRNAVNVGPVTIGPGRPLTLIGGPCVAESRELCLRIGERLVEACANAGMQYIFKASFDKANRSSIQSPRGPGFEAGLELLSSIGDQLKVPVTSDIHESHQAQAAGQVLDLIQIPAFLCRQTDLLVAAAETGRPVNVKKGQFLSPMEMKSVVGKLTSSGCSGVILTDRGTFFGYQRLVNDFPGLVDLASLGWPVCLDATHSTQLPGAQSAEGGPMTSGGRPEMVPMLARLGVVAGADALFIETHPEPAKAASDASSMLELDLLVQEIARLTDLRRWVESAGRC
ncbi:MAG: 3-deoxy-8-phosphooctulonate synthase [Phycisphaeraceae bacterium]|nr:3-deoxy-8-phosphooctulonate synthase [Phycisphaeraceae bacterium]